MCGSEAFFMYLLQPSFHFPKGKEPYAWAMAKINDCWRGYKCQLKVIYFDGRSNWQLAKTYTA